MKKLLTIIGITLLMGCSKEDVCECYYSEELNQYIPFEGMEPGLIEDPLTGERMQALHRECKVKGC